MKKQFILSALLLSFSTTLLAHGKLIFAIDLVRHGNRTPTTELPTIPFVWKEGLGQLTTKGMQMEYQFGSTLRKRYVDSGLLPSQYKPGTVYVRSSDLDRTLMSAQSLLMGLYPVGTGPTFQKKWAIPPGVQPIPIHTTPREEDNLIVAWTESSKFDSLLVPYVYSTQKWKDKTTELSPKFKDWSIASGVPINTLYQTKFVGDSLAIYQEHNVPLPKGLDKAMAQEIIDAGRWVFLTAFEPHPVGQATSKNLMKAISDYMKTAASGNSSLKYVLLLSHDSTQLSLMSAMHNPLKILPPYVSNLNFSLYEDGNIKITHNGKPVLLPGCTVDKCTIEQFDALRAEG